MRSRYLAAPRTLHPGSPASRSSFYVILLSFVSEAVAFTGIGLVAKWGEAVPGWIPVLRGRRVSTRAAVIAAGLGAALLTLLCTWAAVHFAMGQRTDGSPRSALAPLNFNSWRGSLAVAAYAPLVLWGPLLAAVTFAYYRRRRSPAAPTG